MFKPDDFPTSTYDKLYQKTKNSVFQSCETNDTIKKENTELKRINTGYAKLLKDPSTEELLNKKDYEILKKAEAVLLKLKSKRSKALRDRLEAEDSFNRALQRRYLWLKKETRETSTEFQLKVVRAGLSYIPSYITTTKEVEEEFDEVLKTTFGRFVEKKEDAPRVFEEINKTLSNKDDPRIQKLNSDVELVMKRLI